MTPNLFTSAVSQVDWSINRQSKDGKEHRKLVKKRAGEQSWKTRKSKQQLKIK